MRIKQIRVGFLHLLATVALAAASVPAAAQVVQPSICKPPSGYVLGFFNGVWNTPGQAKDSLEELQATLGDSYNGEKVDGQLFYNTTGAIAGSTGWQDVVEVFDQRSAELDGALAGRWEYFWEALSGQGTWSTRVAQAWPAAGSLFGAISDSFSGKTVAALLSMTTGSPPTAADYERHNNRVSDFVVQRKKLLLVAHSQGNLFVNQAYSTAVRVGSRESVQTVHIAPASTQLHGEYALSRTDLVISALLRLAAPGAVPAWNIDLAASTADLSGHKLQETYLDPGRAGLSVIRGQMTTALARLVVPQTNGVEGFFTVTLTWDGPGDVDLHTFEPGGSHVFYSRPTGQAGSLDTDNVFGLGPEHYYASCDPTRLQTGVYQIGINNYQGATGRRATVQVASSAAGIMGSKTVDVGPTRGGSGDVAPIPIFTVSVTKNSSGTYAVSAQ